MYKYEDTSTWHGQYGKSLGRVFPDEYQAFLQGNQYAFSEIPANDYEKLAKDFWKNFSCIRAFHGCRVVDESSYKERGIEPLNYSNVEELVVKLLSGTQPGVKISSNEIESAIDQCKAPVREGRVFLALDSRHLRDGGGIGFVKYGSEFVFVCLIQLVGRTAAIEILERSGRKCIIECVLPVDSFDLETLGSLCFNTLGPFIETAMRLTNNLYVVDLTLSPSLVTPTDIVTFEYQ